MGEVAWDILLTRGLVWVLYVAAFIRACQVDQLIRRNPTSSWSRRASLHIMMVISGYWIGFYSYLILTSWDDLSSTASLVALFSRVGHFIVAVGLWTIASFLKMVAEQYAIVPVKDENE